MDRRLYADYADDWDAARFRAFVLRRCRPGDFLLDLGAGRGHLEAFDYRSAVRRVAGVDPDEAVLQNPQVHEARLLPLPSGVIPYDDATFDVVVAANVLEHVEDPHACFTEVRRVLKPGGKIWSWASAALPRTRARMTGTSGGARMSHRMLCAEDRPAQNRAGSASCRAWARIRAVLSDDGEEVGRLEWFRQQPGDARIVHVPGDLDIGRDEHHPHLWRELPVAERIKELQTVHDRHHDVE